MSKKNQWASGFKSKEEKAIDSLDEEIKGWEAKIKAHEKEILSGAPDKDFGGVVALKRSLELAINEKGKATRKRTKLIEQATGQNK